MSALFLAAALLAEVGAAPASAVEPRPHLIVVLGAAGEDEYAGKFLAAAAEWEALAHKAGASLSLIGKEALLENPSRHEVAPPAQEPAEAVADSAYEAAGRDDPSPPLAGPRAEDAAGREAASDRQRLQEILSHLPKAALGEVWLVLIGHGTYDGKEARFNLSGPDVSASELATWTSEIKSPLAVLALFSASAPFLKELSAPGRAIISATRSGSEVNYSRLAEYFPRELQSEQADLDQDGQVSLLEAFLRSAQAVAEFYRSANRLATEHALLDDNGDGRGTPAEWFRGVRATRKAADAAATDGARARQFVLIPTALEQQLTPEFRARRNELERSIETLRENKASLPEEEYYQKLESILLELARLYKDGAETKSP